MSILFYLLIFVLKTFEVSIATVRLVLIAKGEKKIGAIIAFFEVLLWLFLASFVLNDIMADPLKAVVYALGFSVGNYLGSTLESKLGFGLSFVQIIVKEEHGALLAKQLRDESFAVTVVNGEGKNQSRHILFMYVKRKRVLDLLESVKEKQPNAVVTVMDTKNLYGGYGMRK